jgi:hypothetical protein
VFYHHSYHPHHHLLSIWNSILMDKNQTNN